MISASYSLTATERVLPRMAVDFTTAVLDPRITFTRAGNTATVINSSGVIVGVNADIPRFDFDPVTLVCRGLLIEESRTNSTVYSEDMTNAAGWTPAGSITGASVDANSGISPDGTTNADFLKENTSTSEHGLEKYALAFTSGTPVTISFYIKSTNRSLRVLLPGSEFGSDVIVKFDPITGTSSLIAGTCTHAIRLSSSGFYRITLTATPTVTTTGYAQLRLFNGNNTNYTGDGTSGMFIWGAQCENGSFATSYIPTAGSQVTRSSELAVMTGTNFTSWFNESEGTLVVSASTNSSATLLTFQISSDDNNRVGIGFSSMANIFRIRNGGAAADPANITASASGYLAAVAYKVASSAASSNASALTTSSPATMTSRTTASFGSSLAGNFPQNGHIRRAAYYPLRLTNAELQAFSKI